MYDLNKPKGIDLPKGLGKSLYSSAMKRVNNATVNSLDLIKWGKKFCAGLMFYGCSEHFHVPLARIYDETMSSQGNRTNVIAPRGNAKTTYTQLLVLRTLLENVGSYVIVAMEAGDQAKLFMDGVANELETNEEIKEHYGTAALKGETWNSDTIVTLAGSMLQVVGTGKKVRGRKHKGKRPSLMVIDDPQNEDGIRSPTNRKNDIEWLEKSWIPAGETKKTNYIIVGTNLHSECIVSHVKKLPSFRTIEFASIVKWPDNMLLWDTWTELYLSSPNVIDRSTGTLTRDMTKAEEFLDKHYDEMHEGAIVLWEEKESLVDLMKLRAESPVAFNSEKMNKPYDPSAQLFKPEYFDNEDVWFDTLPDESDLVARVSYIDYAQGKQKKRNDFSAIVTLSYYGGINVYVDAWIERRNVEETNQMLVNIVKVLKHTLAGAETVNFQELAKDDLENKLKDNQIILEVVGVDNKVNKDIRIGRLAPWNKLKVFKYRRNCQHCNLLIQQKLNFGQPSEHDDGPDAEEGAMRLLTSVTGLTGGNADSSGVSEEQSENEEVIAFIQ